MSGGDDTPCSRVVAPVPPVICRIAEKNTGDRTRAEFVLRGRRLVRKTEAAEDVQVIVSGGSAKEKLMGCHGAGGVARPYVDQVCGRG